MVRSRWILALIITIFILGGVQSAYAGSSDESAVEFLLLITHREVPTGAAVPMQLFIQTTKPIRNLRVNLVDHSAWAWVQEFDLPPVINKAAVFKSSIAPEALGALSPGLILEYQLGSKVIQEYIAAEGQIIVKELHEFVTFSIMTQQGTVELEDEVDFDIGIVNRSPFEVTLDRVSGVGIDLEWEPYSGNETFAPGEDVVVMSASVKGEHPQPQIFVEYTWNDSLGRGKSAISYIEGREIHFRSGSSFLERIPFEYLAIFLGIFAGAVSLVVNDRITKYLQRGTNRQQVYGMLQLAIMEVNHAMMDGAEIRLEMLEAVIKTEGFYQVLARYDLIDQVKELWDEAMRHNRSLNLPGNVQREKELRRAVDTLNGAMQRLSMGWVKYKLEGLFTPPPTAPPRHPL